MNIGSVNKMLRFKIEKDSMMVGNLIDKDSMMVGNLHHSEILKFVQNSK